MWWRQTTYEHRRHHTSYTWRLHYNDCAFGWRDARLHHTHVNQRRQISHINTNNAQCRVRSEGSALFICECVVLAFLNSSLWIIYIYYMCVCVHKHRQQKASCSSVLRLRQHRFWYADCVAFDRRPIIVLAYDGQTQQTSSLYRWSPSFCWRMDRRSWLWRWEWSLTYLNPTNTSKELTVAFGMNGRIMFLR